MIDLLLLCLAAAALVAWTSSAAIGAGLALGRGWLAQRAPAARARLALAAALVPSVATAVVLVAALAPSFGWIADHCIGAGDPHTHHPHICAHHMAGGLSLPVMALAAVFGLRLVVALVRTLRLAVRAERSAHALARLAAPEPVGGALVLPLDVRQAFVLGVLHPRLFVTRGLLLSADARHLAAIDAHERAHLRRGDTVRWLVASVAAALHLPGVAGAVLAELAHAHELAADAEAARVVGSRTDVAQALVDLSRALVDAPAGAHAFAGRDLTARVEALLDEAPRSGQPSGVGLAVALGGTVVAVAAAAESVHHGVELLLGTLTP